MRFPFYCLTPTLKMKEKRKLEDSRISQQLIVFANSSFIE